MTALDLHPAPLDAQAFADFGDVIETGGEHFSINGGAIERFHDLARVQTDRQGRVQISLARCNEAATLPCRLTVMERHPLGSQAFIPLGSTPMLVVVARSEQAPQPCDLVAFRTNGRQGINYRRGVWHMPMLGLEPGQRWIIVDREGPGDNCQVVDLPGEVMLHGH